MKAKTAASAILPIVGYMPMPVAFPYKAVFLHGRPRHQKYDDFWRKHPPMDIGHRAKIFAPFSALRGFEECIGSKEILYTDRQELSPDQILELDRNLAILQEGSPEAVVTYFVPCSDIYNFAFGRQGRYETVIGSVQKIDPDVTHTITINHQTIDITDIFCITIPSPDGK